MERAAATMAEPREARRRAASLRSEKAAADIILAQTTKFIAPEVAFEAAVSLQEKEVTQATAAIDWFQAIDWLIPEELLGLDITPTGQQPRDPGFLGIGAKPQVVNYNNVWIEDGKVKVIRNGKLRVLGYTPREAKKRFKTKRRRKRLTKRDMYIIEALKENPKAGALALMV